MLRTVLCSILLSSFCIAPAARADWGDLMSGLACCIVQGLKQQCGGNIDCMIDRAGDRGGMTRQQARAKMREAINQCRSVNCSGEGDDGEEGEE